MHYFVVAYLFGWLFIYRFKDHNGGNGHTDILPFVGTKWSLFYHGLIALALKSKVCVKAALLAMIVLLVVSTRQFTCYRPSR